jgi:triphosphatase
LEWQLAAADLGAVQRWLSEHQTIRGLVIEPRSTLEVHDTYFDTSDWRIRHAGFALRMRNAAGESEATLKELRPPKDGKADRRELNEALTDTSPGAIVRGSGPVGTRVNAVAGAHELQALFSASTTRQRFGVRKQDGTEDLAEITLDATVFSRPDGKPQASTQVVEVEARTGESPPLEELVKAMSDGCALKSAAASKYALGLQSLGLTPPQAPALGAADIDASMSAVQIAFANLRRHLSRWIAHEPGARLGEDPEELHDMRVAGRRLDAALALFAPYLPAVLARTRPRLKALIEALGGVRDLDVQLAKLDTFQREIAATDRAAIQPLRDLLDADRAQARLRLLRMLDSEKTEKWLARLKAELLKPSAVRTPLDHEPITAAAPVLIRSRHKKLRKAVAHLTAESSMEDYDAARGRIKKLRYAIESVAPIYGKPADALLRSLRRLQDALGEQQDAHVTLTRLQALTRQHRTHLSAEASFLMGRMAERHAAAATRGRDAFAKRYPKLRKRWKRLRLRLDGVDSRARQPADSTSPPGSDDRTS